jgi:hypothetical protein
MSAEGVGAEARVGWAAQRGALVGSFSARQQWGAYNYADDSPISQSDPTGLDPCSTGGQGCTDPDGDGIYTPQPAAGAAAATPAATTEAGTTVALATRPLPQLM